MRMQNFKGKRRAVLAGLLAVVILFSTGFGVPLVARGEETEAAQITGASITAGQDLTMNYYVKINDTAAVSDVEKLSMKFTFNGEETTVTEYTEENGEYVFSFTGIAPQCMADTIRAELLYDDEVIASKDDYSVKENARTLLEEYSDNAKLVQFVTDMLYYGAAAQNYKDYNTDNLANLDITGMGTASDELPGSTDNVRNVGEKGSETVYFTAAGVWFDNVNKLYVKFYAEDETEVKVMVGNTTYTASDFTPVEDTASTYILYTDGIYPTQFDKTYTFNLYEGESKVQTLKYSINSYCYAKMGDDESSLTTMEELARALYRYGASAEAYLHSHSLTKTDRVEATATDAGHLAYWYCEGCQTYFADAEGTEEIGDAEALETWKTTEGEGLIPKVESGYRGEGTDSHNEDW